MTALELQTTTWPTIPSYLQSYTWRRAHKDDMPAIYQLMLDIDQTDDKNFAGTLADQTREFNDPWSPPETDSLVALTPTGQVAAYARVLINPEPESAGELRSFLFADVHPVHRGRGLGDFVLNWMEARAAERLHASPGDRPRLLRLFCLDSRVDRITLFERHGFKPIRRSYRMRRDVRRPLPEVMVPAGLTLRTYGADVDERTRLALNEAFRDHWGTEPVTAEDWRMFFIENTGFRPDLSFLIMDGEEVAGFSVNKVSPEENAREGIQKGWIGDLGTRRPWRKRGVATALLAASMRAFKEAGLDYAALGVDTENPTGALRVYERMGFEPYQRTIIFGKYLP